MPRRRVLVVEDDPAIRRAVVDALRFEGYEPIEEATFAGGRDAALRASVDLVLLDLVLPGGDGLALLADVRLAQPTLPIIILTARGDEADRIAGLRLGADDYLVKPFGIGELLARVAAVLRRSAERPLAVDRIDFAGGAVDLARGQVLLAGGAARALSEKETEVLAYLARAGRVVSRAELLERVWKLPPHAVSTRTIDMTIMRLREKLGDEGAEPRVVLTVRGKGYLFQGRS